jgi:hypothetical protein
MNQAHRGGHTARHCHCHCRRCHRHRHKEPGNGTHHTQWGTTRQDWMEMPVVGDGSGIRCNRWGKGHGDARGCASITRGWCSGLMPTKVERRESPGCLLGIKQTVRDGMDSRMAVMFFHIRRKRVVTKFVRRGDLIQSTTLQVPVF